MLLMESYMCYCSVRLGVIIVSVLAIIRELAHSITLFALGVKVFEPLNDLFEHDAEYKNRKWVRKSISWSEDDPEVLSAVVHIISFMHSAAACLSIYGAIKLRKWFLLPLAFFEFVYFIHITFLHIVLMIMLKKQINLGFLIILTLLGCFYILFVGYNACTCVAMFQIIGLVKSARYCELYGDDPFHPLAMRSNRSKDSEKPLHVLRMHEMHDTNIDEEKRLSKLGLWPRRQPPVVSVLPVQAAYPHPPLKWWQQQALSTGDDHQSDPSVYRNWHTNELLNGVGGDFQRKSELNRRYAENQLHRWY
ncbi:uncharacterized protein LOC6731105 [Drosophila simulans]|uniref:GD22638 n=1 Tax=Drosophila simulans TaxID=7240 RepID=B4Q414_DROSI|nr:uncharacterized protein LOC6731105 [Drosophila simulans]EDX03847.1 GD22638 [Drosophila simulans]KMY88353.1 uncharacterized protein Dsimw501_GD22638 [Drosophila simulans]